MKIILKEDDEAILYLKNEIRSTVKDAFRELMGEISGKKEVRKEEDEWCDSKRAREILGVKKTKMQEIRDNSPQNGIRISRESRPFRYYVPSLITYLEKRIS